MGACSLAIVHGNDRTTRGSVDNGTNVQAQAALIHGSNVLTLSPDAFPPLDRPGERWELHVLCSDRPPAAADTATWSNSSSSMPGNGNVAVPRCRAARGLVAVLRHRGDFDCATPQHLPEVDATVDAEGSDGDGDTAAGACPAGGGAVLNRLRWDARAWLVSWLLLVALAHQVLRPRLSA